MKKLLLSVFTLVAIGFAGSVNAQFCGSVSNCIPQDGPVGGGFDPADSVPCVVKGTSYNHSIQFTMFNTFDFIGHHNVDSIEFVSITNLPCGLCWSVNQADKRYSKNVAGCLNISGTTTDVAGQYKFQMLLKVWIDGQASQLIPPNLVDQAGIKLFIRVKDNAGSSCASVDTATSFGGNLVAGCTTGIEDVSSSFSAMNIAPNPMTSGAVLSFVSDNNASYTMRISNITGQVVTAKELDVKQGANNIAIERNGLPAGIYFVTLNDGKATLTQRFSIAE